MLFQVICNLLHFAGGVLLHRHEKKRKAWRMSHSRAKRRQSKIYRSVRKFNSQGTCTNHVRKV